MNDQQILLAAAYCVVAVALFLLLLIKVEVTRIATAVLRIAALKTAEAGETPAENYDYPVSEEETERFREWRAREIERERAANTKPTV